MKKISSLIAVLLFAAAGSLWAEDYGFDKAHSQVSFAVKHVLAMTHGEFKDYDGTVVFDEKKPESSKIDVTIQTASIDTANEMRDHHLKTADFFDAEKYPTLTFKSTKVVKAGDKKYKVTGDLTIHGVTKSVVLDVDYLGADVMMGMPIAGFSATTTIDRRDFGLSWGQDKLSGAGNLIVANEVQIKLDISLITKEALKKMAEKAKKPAAVKSDK
jgi:polyisoprenoid-binding protein YceI